MSILRIFDVSQYISAGVADTVVTRGVIQDQGMFRPNQMPVAGLNVMLNVIHEFRDEDSIMLFVADSTPTIKREMYRQILGGQQEYKGTRPQKRPHILIQRRMITEVLEECGFQVMKIDGYEADDIIASLVELYDGVFDHIYIHNRDSDLFYLVRDGVSMEPVAFSGKKINRHNWEGTVRKDYYVPYNTLTLDKIVRGDVGDNIPPIPKNYATLLQNSLDPNNYEYLGDLYILRNWIAKVVDNDEMVLGIFDLITPLEVPVNLLGLNDEPLNYNMYKDFCRAFNNKYFKQQGTNTNNIVVEDMIAKYLKEYNND